MFFFAVCTGKSLFHSSSKRYNRKLEKISQSKNNSLLDCHQIRRFILASCFRDKVFICSVFQSLQYVWAHGYVYVWVARAKIFLSGLNLDWLWSAEDTKQPCTKKGIFVLAITGTGNKTQCFCSIMRLFSIVFKQTRCLQMQTVWIYVRNASARGITRIAILWAWRGPLGRCMIISSPGVWTQLLCGIRIASELHSNADCRDPEEMDDTVLSWIRSQKWWT